MERVDRDDRPLRVVGVLVEPVREEPGLPVALVGCVRFDVEAAVAFAAAAPAGAIPHALQ